MSLTLIAIFLSLLITIFVYFIGKVFSSKGLLAQQRSINQRLSEVSFDASASTSQITKKHYISDINFLSDFLKKYASSEHIAILLKTAKVPISVSVFLLVSLSLGFISLIIIKNRIPFSLAVPASVVIAAVPFMVLIFLRKRYILRFNTYLPDALGIISNSIKVGHGLETALDVVARNAPYPLNVEFKTVQSEMQLGVSLQKALKNLYHRIGSAELKIFITGVSIHLELGGNLSEILDTLQRTIRARFALAREVVALSAQGILSAWVIFSVPFIITYMLYGKDATPLVEFAKSAAGSIMLKACVVLQVIAFFWMKKIVTIKD